MPAGRPSEYPGLDDKRIVGILALLRKMVCLDTACKKHRIPRSTFNLWCKTHEELMSAKNEAQADASIEITDRLVEEDGPTWSKWMTMLERRDPANYSTQVKLAIKDFEAQLVDSLSDLDEATRELVLERMASIDISR